MEAKKNDLKDGKAPLHHLRPEHIEGMCSVFEWAEKTKYAPQENGQPNYLLGLEKKRLLAAALRHLLAAVSGEEFDSESNERHTDHVMCNIAMMNGMRKAGTLKGE